MGRWRDKRECSGNVTAKSLQQQKSSDATTEIVCCIQHFVLRLSECHQQSEQQLMAQQQRNVAQRGATAATTMLQ